MGVDTMMDVHDMTGVLYKADGSPTDRTKVCPRCGALLFEDMLQCFGCLYDFERDNAREYTQLIPEDQDDASTTLVSAKHLAPESRALALKVCTPQLMITCPIPDEGLSIGRGSENDVVICDRMVSRRHVRVFRSKGGAIAEDQ